MQPKLKNIRIILFKFLIFFFLVCVLIESKYGGVASNSGPTYNANCDINVDNGDCDGSSASGFSGTAGSNNWYTSNVTVTAFSHAYSNPDLCSSVTDNRNYSWTFSAEGNNTFNNNAHAATSHGGVCNNRYTRNNATVSGNVWIDKTAPTNPASLGANYGHTFTSDGTYKCDSADWCNFNNPKIYIADMGSDATSGIWQNEYKFGSSEPGAIDTTITKLGASVSAPGGQGGIFAIYTPTTLPTSGSCSTYYVYAKAIDFAGLKNANYVTLANFKYDGTTPNAPTIGVDPANPIVNGWISNTTITLTATDGCSGISNYLYQWPHVGASYLSSITGDNISTSFADGTYSFNAKSVDNAKPNGNQSAVSNTTFYIDRTKPYLDQPVTNFQLPLVSIEPYLSFGFYNRQQLKNGAMQMAIKVKDDTSGIWNVKWKFDDNDMASAHGTAINNSAGCVIGTTTNTSCSTFNINSSNPFIDIRNVNSQSSTSINTVAIDGDHQIYFEFQDRAGNIETSLKSFKTDSHAPCELSSNNCKILINSVYDNLVTGAKPTNNPNVDLILSVSDGAGSGVEGVQIISYHKADNIKPNPTNNIGMIMGEFGSCKNGMTNLTYTTKALCTGNSGTWESTTNSSVAGYYSGDASTSGSFFKNTDITWASKVPSTVSSFNLSHLPVPNQGYYVVCARFRDNVGNITAVNQLSDDTTNRWAYKVIGNTNADILSGDIPWGGASGNNIYGSLLNYGNNKVCTYVNLDTQSPGGPQDFKLFANGLQLSGGALGRAPDFYDNDGNGNFAHPIITNSPVWTNISSIDLKFKLPTNLPPGTGISKMKYLMTGNFDATNPINPLGVGEFNEVGGLLTDIQSGSCSSASYTSQLACEDKGFVWTDLGSCSGGTITQAICLSMNGVWTTSCSVGLNSASACLTAGGTWNPAELTKTIAYNSITQFDGCKNLYIWLGDEAGNFITKDSGGNNDINFNAALYCFDDQLPGKVGLNYVNSINSSALVAGNTLTNPGAATLKFYDYTLLSNATTAFVSSIRHFKPNAASNLGDRSDNVRNVNILRTRDSNNQLYSLGEEGHRLAIAWIPVEDIQISPHNASGLIDNKPYRICFSKTLGLCEFFKDTYEPYDDNITNGYVGTLVNKYQLYAFDATTARCVNKPDVSPYNIDQTNCTTYVDGTGIYGVWQKEMEIFTTGTWYFYIETRDKAGNVSTSNPISMIIDNTPPCVGTACDLSLNNSTGNISYLSAGGALQDESGLSSFKTIRNNSVVKYIRCGDDESNGTDPTSTTGGCDVKFKGTNPFNGGIRGQFTITANDNVNGSGFNTNPSSGNVQFGVGLDVWTVNNQEIVYWYPPNQPHLNTNHSILAGTVNFWIHLFERDKTQSACNNNVGGSTDASAVCVGGSGPGCDGGTWTYTTGTCFTYYNTPATQPSFIGDGTHGFTPTPYCTISGYLDSTTCTAGGGSWITDTNIKRIIFTENDGREALSNIYIRLKDIAGNWSPFDAVNDVGIIKQTIIVDTKPPARMFKAAATNNYIEIKNQNTDLTLARVIDNDDDGIADYCNGALCGTVVGYFTNIFDTKIVPTNNTTFKIVMTKPIDLSTITKGYYKINSPPDGPVDYTGTFDATGMFFNLAVSTNYPDIYLWFEDKSTNPNASAVARINDYYRQGICDFTNPGVNNVYPAVTVNQFFNPDLPAGPGHNYPAIAYGEKGNNPCRVSRFQLPFDNTKPIWPNINVTYPTPASMVPTPFINSFWLAGTESTNTATPTFHYFPASDTSHQRCSINPQANNTPALCTTSGGVWQTKESGLRSFAVEGDYKYKLCLDPLAPPACGSPFGTDNQTATFDVKHSDGISTGALAIPYTAGYSLAAGYYYFSVLAYDRAGNESNPSPSRRILIDTQAPCSGSDNCTLTARSVPGQSGVASQVENREWSTNHQDGGIKLVLIGQDEHSGIKDFQVAEQYNRTSTNQCITRFLSYDNVASAYRMKRLVNNADNSVPANNAFGGTNEIRRYVTAGPCPANINFDLAGPTGINDNSFTNDTIVPYPVGSTSLTINYSNLVNGFIISKDQDGSHNADGPKDLQVRFRDNAGNWGNPIGDSIIYDTIEPNAPIAVVSDPVGWNRKSFMAIRVTLPTNDLSSPTNSGSPPGAPYFGIKSIYYVISPSTLEYSNAFNVKIEDAINLGGGVFAFNINASNIGSGVRTVYVWLEDDLENRIDNPASGNASVQIFPDITAPIAPGKPEFDLTKPNLTPLITWDASAENGTVNVNSVGLFSVVPGAVATACYNNATSAIPANLLPAYTTEATCTGNSGYWIIKDSVEDLQVYETYKLCWDVLANNPLGCTNFRWVGAESYDFAAMNEELPPGDWSFSLFAYDRVGNRSPQSLNTAHSVVPPVPFLVYVGQGAYFDTVVLPSGTTKAGQEGEYTFKVLYREGAGRPPDANDHHIMLDLNGNGVFDGDEVFEMTKLLAGSSTPQDHPDFYDDTFVNGELYYVTLKLPFVRETFGKLRYRFKFKATSIVAIKFATSDLDPTKDQYVEIQRYSSEGVNVAEVRNNIQRPDTREPVVLIINPPKDPSTSINAVIVDRNGRLVKKLIDNKPYSQLERDYLYWDKTDQGERPVASGLYYVVVRIQDTSTMKKVVVVR